MARRPRPESASGIHHVMNRGVDHQAVFFADTDRVEFGRRLAAIHDAHGVVTLAYALMTNHFHLVVRAPDGVLSDAMHHLTSVYSHRTNARRGRDGPLFRGRFHSIPVESDEYLLWVTRYVHRNPLDLPQVRSLAGYRWSSYRAYLGRRAVAPFLDLQPVLSLIGSTSEVAAFTEPERHRIRLRSAVEVHRLVTSALAVDDLHHEVSPATQPRIDRTLLVLLFVRCRDEGVTSLLAQALGGAPDDATRWRRAVVQAHHRLVADPGLARVLGWLERELGWQVSPRSHVDDVEVPGTLAS